MFSELTDYLFDKGHLISKPLIEDIINFIESKE